MTQLLLGLPLGLLLGLGLRGLPVLGLLLLGLLLLLLLLLLLQPPVRPRVQTG